MNVEQLADSATAAALGADWLIAELEPVSDYGRRHGESVYPFASGQEAMAAARADAVAAFAGAVDPARVDALRQLIRGVPDATGAIARAGMGDVLSDVNFLEMQRFCDVVAQVHTLAGNATGEVPQPCTEVMRVLEPGRSGKFGFYLEDRFDADLAVARENARDAQTAFDAARERVGARVAGALGRAVPASDEFIVMREDLRGPLPAGVHVAREAPTYVLCELELDEPALAALQARDETSKAVAEAEQRVRARLSANVRESVAALEAAALALGAFDVLVAAARFTQRFACVPASYESECAIDVEDAHFLPLQSVLEREPNRSYIPISVRLDGAAVLTGPNMGGKTVALQTCGFIAMCAAFGLPVPAKRARVALFRRIVWLGIGVREEAGGLLSSFAREVVRLRDTLHALAEPSLLLIDEFARTTTPDEGRALLLALIEHLELQGVCAFIATHLSGIARDADIPHFAVRGLRGVPQAPPGDDLQEALAALARSMDYTIEPVTSERSQSADAIFLAGLLGMDDAFIQTAWRKLGGGEPPAS